MELLPHSLTAAEVSSTIATFDVDVMDKYGVNKSNLPKDTVYINDQSNTRRNHYSFLQHWCGTVHSSAPAPPFPQRK